MCIRFKTQGDIYGDGKREWPVEKESRDGGRGGSRLPIRFGEEEEEEEEGEQLAEGKWGGWTQVLPSILPLATNAAGHQEHSVPTNQLGYGSLLRVIARNRITQLHLTIFEPKLEPC